MFYAQAPDKTRSFGNTFIHENGESVVFGEHNFDEGSYGVLPGIVGTQRRGFIGYFGFSSFSLGWKGANSSKHVDGYVKTYSSDPFTFPIGDNGVYRPIAITGASETSAAYFAADPDITQTTDLFGVSMVGYPEGGPFPRSEKNRLVNLISSKEYWDVDGDRPTKITLTWDVNSDIGNLTNYDIQRLTIVGWNGDQWVEIPSTVDVLYLSNERSTPTFFGGISNLITGSITTDEEIIPNDYVVITLGSLDLAIVGDRVWDDLNRNGIQDSGEPGIPNVKVQLIDDQGAVYMETYTSSNGQFYLIGIPFGMYKVRFETPQDYSITIPGQGSVSQNSDVTFSGETIPFVIYGNETEYNIDAGFYKTTTIGDLVWFDENVNGMQDAEEVGAPGIRVELLNEEFLTLASTLTNSSGFYQFTNLPPENYYIRFVIGATQSFSPYHSVPLRDLDSDADPATGLTELISLLSGEKRFDIDAGISSPCAYSAVLFTNPSSCGESLGSAGVAVSGDSCPYSYEWSTGDTGSLVNLLPSGQYTLTITDDELCTATIDFEIVDSVECIPICADLDIHVFLEGPYNYDAQKMDPHLNDLGYLPGQRPETFFGKYTEPGQPYNESPWFYNGTEGFDFTSGTKNNNNDYYPELTVDWVLVSLRSEENLENNICTRAGLLMENGAIEFVNDDCCLIDPRKSYYVVIEHRNHLMVMTPQAIPVVDSTLSFDFRENQSFIRLLGSGQKEVGPGVYAMYTANGDQYVNPQSVFDINVSDLTEWLKENGKHSSYYKMDFDMNGDANVQDKGIYLDNIGIFTDVPKN
jgi:hypothetical protein